MPTLAAAVAAAYTAITATTIGTIAFQIAVGLAVSAIGQLLMPKPEATRSGIRTKSTLTGGDNPASFVLGWYATEGALVCPPMSHGKVGKVPNAYLTYVVELGDIPGQEVDYLILDGEKVTIDTSLDPDNDYGYKILGRYDGYAWIKFYDGSQTAADPMLLDKYGSGPNRPWTAEMVGAGIPYAILTFRYNRKLYNGFPKVRFVTNGIPLYDPRKDSTAGGSGTHRWNDISTWEVSNNTAVQIYNVLRGIDFGNGEIWGGQVPADALPYDNWSAAMDRADEAVTLADSSTQPRFRSGYEVFADDEPANIIDELLNASNGTLAEIGGVFKIRLGRPELPVKFIDDNDIIITKPQDYNPFPGLQDSRNGISATFPAPIALWENHNAPTRVDADAVAEDGKRLIGDVTFSAAPYGKQVQRLMRAYLKDERRFRRHIFNLPPDGILLEPLDVLSYDSAANGYDSKRFDVHEIAVDYMVGMAQVSLRERDPDDYDWDVSFELDDEAPAGGWELPATQFVPGFSVSGISVKDDDGTDRRPAIKIAWDGTELEDVRGLDFEVRLASTSEIVQRISTSDVESGEHIVSSGILNNVTYEVRAILVVDRPVDWTVWTSIATPNTYIKAKDIEPGGLSYNLLSSAALNSLDSYIDVPSYINAARIEWQADDGVIEEKVNRLQATAFEQVWSVGAFEDYAIGEVPGDWEISDCEVVTAPAVTGWGDWTKVLKITETGSGVTFDGNWRYSNIKGKIFRVSGIFHNFYGTGTPTIGIRFEKPDGSFVWWATAIPSSSPAGTAGTEAIPFEFDLPAIPSETVSWKPYIASTGTASSYTFMFADIKLLDASTIVNVEETTAVAASTKGDLAGMYMVEVDAGNAASAVFQMTAFDSNGDKQPGTSQIFASAENILLDGTVFMRHLVVTDFSNLIGDSDIQSEQDWDASGATVATIDKDAKLTWNNFLSTGAWTFDMSVGTADEVVDTLEFKIDEGEDYYVRAQRQSADNCAGFVSIRWIDANGIEIGNNNFANINVTGGALVTTYEGIVQAPAGTVRAKMRIFVNDVGSNNVVRVGGIACRKAANGKLVVDGTIEGRHLVVDQDISSTNYIAGTQGWNINRDGTAEFANLVVRDWLVDGSVSDREKVFYNLVGSPYEETSTSYAEVDPDGGNSGRVVLPAAEEDDLWICAMYVVFRANGADIAAADVQFQINPQYDGVWQGWETLVTFSRSATFYGNYRHPVILGNGFDGFRIRLVARAVPDTGGGTDYRTQIQKFEILTYSVKR